MRFLEIRKLLLVFLVVLRIPLGTNIPLPNVPGKLFMDYEEADVIQTVYNYVKCHTRFDQDYPGLFGIRGYLSP